MFFVATRSLPESVTPICFLPGSKVTTGRGGSSGAGAAPVTPDRSELDFMRKTYTALLFVVENSRAVIVIRIVFQRIVKPNSLIGFLQFIAKK